MYRLTGCPLGLGKIKLREDRRAGTHLYRLWLISHVKQDDMDYVPYIRKIVGKVGFISSLLSRYFR